jgi:hypothetical protein
LASAGIVGWSDLTEPVEVLSPSLAALDWRSQSLPRISRRGFLKNEPALPCGIGQRFNASVKQISSPIEHHGFDILCKGALCNELSDRFGRLAVVSALDVFCAFFIERRCRSQCLSHRIVNDLGIDMKIASKNHESRAVSGPENGFTHPQVPPHPRIDF